MLLILGFILYFKIGLYVICFNIYFLKLNIFGDFVEFDIREGGGGGLLIFNYQDIFFNSLLCKEFCVTQRYIFHLKVASCRNCQKS